MSGPKPEPPAGRPPEAERDAHGDPETAERDAAASGFPEPQAPLPGDRTQESSPYSALNNPVSEPDPTEWPDPYESRADPRDPPDPDGEPFGDEPHPASGSTSTSEPHPSDDVEAPDWEGPKRDKVDE